MKEDSTIILNNDQVKIERLKNVITIKDTIINHNNGEYDQIYSNEDDLTGNERFWIADNGIELSFNEGNGIAFYHEFSRVEKGIILNYPLVGDFKLNFKLNYQIIVNFYLGADHLINFRNKTQKNDIALRTNTWHDMEFSRKDGLVSIKANGTLIRTVPSEESLFCIKIYNDHREVSIKEFHATVEPVYNNKAARNNDALLEDRVAYLENYINRLPVIDEVSDLKKDFAQYKNITDKSIDTYNYLFNNLYLDYELKPKRTFNNLHLLIMELIEFVQNVCKKHDLKFWIDAGNLLGAVRHGGFIPWDDDADLGMIREDFLKFEEIIQKEIDEHNLSQYVKIVYHPRKFENQEVKTFLAIRVYSEMKSFKGKRIISNVDILPYDYMTQYEEKGFNKKTRETMHNIYRNKLNNFSKEEWLKQYYDEMDLSFEKSEFVMAGLDSLYLYRFVTETKNLFPLKEIQYEDRTYPCPNNPDGYLKSAYGDYMSIPSRLHRHKRMEKIRYNENNDEIFEKFIKMFREINENF